MKKLLLVASILAFFSCKTPTKQPLKTDVTTNRIEVLDFYGKHRCTSCIEIENNTKATLKKHFEKELNNKQIIFKMIQWDDPKNDALVNKFMAAGTSLIIYRVKDGKEFTKDLSTFAFKQASNQANFEKGLVKELNLQLQQQ